MSIQIAFNNEQNVFSIDDRLLALLESCIKHAAQLEKVPAGEVSVTLVDDETIHKMNKQYRQIDRPTDVLSFPMMDERDEGWPQYEEMLPLLGDIVISVPRAIEQAEEYGHSLERELGFLVTHGMLHLVGYDHDNEEAESVMIHKQEGVLASVGLTR